MIIPNKDMINIIVFLAALEELKAEVYGLDKTLKYRLILIFVAYLFIVLALIGAFYFDNGWWWVMILCLCVNSWSFYSTMKVWIKFRKQVDYYEWN